MDSKVVSGSKYFGASCAFIAFHLVPRMGEPEFEHGFQIGEMILLGSARLLALLVERAQRREESLEEKLKKTMMEVEEMKKRRSEDAKANEKVVSIFASHEQSWIGERKRLRLQIQALSAQHRTLNLRNEEAISNLNKKVMEGECALRIKDEAFEEEAKKMNELEEKLQMAEGVAEEFREKAKKEAQDHSYELRKHKTAFAELVSNQRQLEAETGRALRQAEAAKQELEEVIEQKEEAVSMVEKLSNEIIRLEKDAGQKDKILSAMLRKSKFDATEKQMLLKEVKIAKAKKKQAELEMERWRSMWESRHRKGSRAMNSVDAECSQERIELQGKTSGFNPRAILLEYLGAENQKELESLPPKGESVITTIQCLDQYSSKGNDEIDTDDIQELQEWVRLETEKYATILEQRHFAEIEAFTEQMRLKNENLEAFRWRILSMELESKRLHSHIEGLDENLSQLREANLKLESLLLDREKELKSLKEEFSFFVQRCQLNNSNDSTPEVKLIKRTQREKEHEGKANLVSTQKAENKIPEERNWSIGGISEMMHLESHHNRDSMFKESMVEIITTSPTNSPPQNYHRDEPSIILINGVSEVERTENATQDQACIINLITQSPTEEIQEVKEVNIDQVHVQTKYNLFADAGAADKLASAGQSFTKKDSSWKMDIHALGVSYKIKRLKQQLLVLEKLAAMQSIAKDDAVNVSSEKKVNDNKQQLKGFALVMSLLNKQVKRFQSLEEKTDDLCRRMHENSRGGRRRDLRDGKTKEQTKILEIFLEETFQLQRYMVATGQKMMDIQSRISCTFAGSAGLDESAGFNMGQFADVIRTLFKEIQRGLEVRIARIIGDLEGTLACDGILHR